VFPDSHDIFFKAASPKYFSTKNLNPLASFDLQKRLWKAQAREAKKLRASFGEIRAQGPMGNAA